MTKEYDGIYNSIPVWNPRIVIDNPEPRPNLEEFYKQGLLRKSELTHGKYYYGHCRNASVARWNERTQLFSYVRHKFGDMFEENIPHPEDQDGHDIFTPFEETIPNEIQKVKKGFDD